MSISNDTAFELVTKLLPRVKSDSNIFGSFISAKEVFDIIRNLTEEVITEEIFNEWAEHIGSTVRYTYLLLDIKTEITCQKII